jgi:hypothetical protein
MQLSDTEKDSITYIHKANPEMSPRQLHEFMKKRYSPKYRIPGLASVEAILEDRGYVAPLGAPEPRGHKPPVRGVKKPNDLWCAKLSDEPLTLADGTQAGPFSLVDAYTGYVLRLDAVSDPWGLQIDGIFRSAFRQYGQPVAVRTPQAIPFIADEPGMVSDLAVWLFRTGTRLERRPRQPFTAVDTDDIKTAADFGALQRLYDYRRKAINLEPGPASYVKSETKHYVSLLAPESRVWGKEHLADEDGRISFKGKKIKVARSARHMRVTVAPYDWERELYELRLGPVRYGLIDAKNPGKGYIPAPFQPVLSMRGEDDSDEVDWDEYLAEIGQADKIPPKPKRE